MPYSRRSKFTHDERRSPRGFERIRTVKTPSGKEVRIGYRSDGSTAIVSVLTPKKESSAYEAFMAEYGPDGDRRPDLHAHSSPFHHYGMCDDACRKGKRIHVHRRNTRRATPR